MWPHPSHKRVARRYAARPIRLPTREIKALAKKLAQRLHQYGLPKPGRVIAQEDLYVTNVMGDEVEVEVLLTGTPGRDRDPFSKTKKLLNGGFLKRRPKGPVMRVFVNPHFDRKVFEEWHARKIVEGELYRLLAHEMTHAADVWSGKGSVGDLTKSKDDLKRHHHNHPAEVRALMRDVVTHLGDGDYVREYMDDFGMDFNTAFREALKESKWPDIEPYLTPRNQKTILKGVYTYLQDQGLTKAAAASRVASRHMEAGLLQAPPKLVEAVTKWAQATFADRAHHNALAKQSQFDRTGAGIIGGQDTLDLWFKGMKPWKRTPAGKRGEVSTTFDFTDYLDGWRYRHLWDNLNASEQRALRKGPLRPITVTNAFDEGRSGAHGAWSDKRHEFQVWLPADVWMPEVIPDLVEKHDKLIPKTVRHELQHATQVILGALTGQDYGGLPKRKVRQPHSIEEQRQKQIEDNAAASRETFRFPGTSSPRDTARQDQYYRSDLEYQTSLTDAVGDWESRTLPPVQRWLDETNLNGRDKGKVLRWAVRTFVGEGQARFPTLPRDFKRPDWNPDKIKPSEFFTHIKGDRERWTNAVATFYKEIARTTKLASRVASRYAKRPFDLAMNGLKGLDEGKTVTLYHGTTKSFDRFDLTKSRDELVNDFYGKGIFLTPSKNVAWKYANANRNIGFDPSIIDDLKRKNASAGAFLESLYRLGYEGAWETILPESIYEEPPGWSEGDPHPAQDALTEFEASLKGVDPNDLNDLAQYILGTKADSGSSNDLGELMGLLGGSQSTGAPDWIYDTLDNVGLDSSVYRPKVYTVGVTVQNPLITASASEAKKARANGYDSVVFHGSRLVDGWPEVAVFSPRNAKIKKVEVE